jgi:hypothetical protein
MNLPFTSPVMHAGFIHLFLLTTADQLPDGTAAQQPHLTSPPGGCCSRPSNQFTINGRLYNYAIDYYNLPTTNSYFRIFNFKFVTFRAPVSSLALHLEHVINCLLKKTIGGAC